ncbi:MAG: MXAN_5187 C-terminal domain-containing protein [Vicinamibacterales bacterium]
MRSTDVDADLRRLEADLRQLEAEYNSYFAGRLPTPPWETRARVEALVKQYHRAQIRNFAQRFRFSTLQTRFSTLVELWDRGLRAREEGRPGPFVQTKRESERPSAPSQQVLYVAAFQDPMRELEKLEELYERVSEARRETGAERVPFHKFADLVKTHVAKLQASGSTEVAFRVALQDGRVSLTARALKGGAGATPQTD